jgi:uncharacterized protein (DUF433 family)
LRYTVRMASAVDIGTLIVRTPGFVGGRPRIDGTRILVALIAQDIAHGATPEQIVTDFYDHLNLTQVYAAMAFYHANREEIDADIAEENRLYDEMAEEARRNGQETNRPA